MDIGTISKGIFSALSPLFKKFKSVKRISSELLEATDTSLGELWDKIKPIFIEEFEEEGELTDKVENEAIVTYILEKKLKENNELKETIEKILKQSNTKSNDSGLQQDFTGAQIDNQVNIGTMNEKIIFKNK